MTCSISYNAREVSFNAGDHRCCFASALKEAARKSSLEYGFFSVLHLDEEKGEAFMRHLEAELVELGRRGLSFVKMLGELGMCDCCTFSQRDQQVVLRCSGAIWMLMRPIMEKAELKGIEFDSPPNSSGAAFFASIRNIAFATDQFTDEKLAAIKPRLQEVFVQGDVAAQMKEHLPQC